MASDPRAHVVIAGAGVAGVEAFLALTELAADHVEVTLVCRTPSFELRALSVAAPFAAAAERRHFPLAPLARERSARIVEADLAEVRAEVREVVLSDGSTLGYDVLIVAVGARARPAYEHAATFGTEPLGLNDVLADMQQGQSRRIAFLVPPGTTWPLPAYELALMTRRHARARGVDPAITLVTSEATPLGVFGTRASDALAALLDEARIELRTRADATVGPSGRIGLADGTVLESHRVVSLPILTGPGLPGLPYDDDGFVPVDEFGRVAGLQDVYCAGDATDFPLKQGGIAAQEADAAALHVAAGAGAPVEAAPFRPVLRGRLMTGAADTYLLRDDERPGALPSESPLWWPPTKVSGRFLTPWIASLDPAIVAPAPEAASIPVERELPAGRAAARGDLSL